MQQDTPFSKSVRATAEMSTDEVRGLLDSAAKDLMSDRQVLAHLIQSCVPEAASVSLQTLEDECIPDAGRMFISKVPVTREDEAVLGTQVDLSAEGASKPEGGLVRQDKSEDKTKFEGTVFFDILFELRLPNEAEPIILVINVEIQNRHDTPYAPGARAVTYACRLVGRQGANYGHARKVYSIWVMTNPPKKDHNTIDYSGVYMRRGKNGPIQEAPEDMQLHEIVFVNLGPLENEKKKDDFKTPKPEGILRLLDVLFTRKLSVEDKLRIAHEEFDIRTTTRFATDLEDMKKMELELETRARHKGIEEGMIKGAIRLGRRWGGSDDRIADALEKDYGLSHADALREIWKYDHPGVQGQEPAFNI